VHIKVDPKSKKPGIKKINLKIPDHGISLVMVKLGSVTNPVNN
jgi:hypothetical protein